jgi:hypothetical protein
MSTTIPNGELKWFLCVAVSQFGVKANPLDIMSTGGRSVPDPCPFTSKQLGIFEDHDVGGGEIGRFRRCSVAWEKIKFVYRIALNEFYTGTIVGETSPSNWAPRPADNKFVLSAVVSGGFRAKMAAHGILVKTDSAMSQIIIHGHTMWDIERCVSEVAFPQRVFTGVL